MATELIGAATDGRAVAGEGGAIMTSFARNFGNRRKSARSTLREEER